MHRKVAHSWLVLRAATAGMVLFVVGHQAARAATGTWSIDADGNWSDSGNWSAVTVADGTDSTANFTNNISAPRTVTLDTNRTIGNLTFSDNGAAGSSWVISGSNTLTLDRSSGTPAITATTNTTISAPIAGTDGLSKSGAGLLELAGTNTYSGTTTISAGDLRAIDGVGLPAGSSLVLAGTAASFQSSGTFTRALGTGAGQVQLSGSGGFSAGGGPLTVQIGGNTNMLTWGSTPNFVSTVLVLSSATADNVVDFQNGMDLNTVTNRIFNVIDNPSSTSDAAQISGPISGATGDISKFGNGTLILTGTNTYEGTVISSNSGTLQIGNGGTTGTLGTSNVVVNILSTLAFNRSDAFTVSNNISNQGSVRQAGSGTVTLTGSNTYSGNSILAAGTLNLGSANALPSSSFIDFVGGTLQFSAANNFDCSSRFLNTAGKQFKLDTNGQNVALATVIFSPGSTLTKLGAGTLTMTAGSNSTGNTTIHEGTLKLSGTASIDQSAVITVGDVGSTNAHFDATTKTGGETIYGNQTLKGIGQLDGTFTILGIHAPGNSAGLQTANGDLAYSAGSILNWELATNASTDTAAARGIDFDAVDSIAGTLGIASGVTSILTFNAPGSTVNFTDPFWDANHSWLVYDNVNSPTLTSAAIFDTIYPSTDPLSQIADGSFSWTQQGNDVYLQFTPAVPEPTSLVLIALGGLMALRPRRRA